MRGCVNASVTQIYSNYSLGSNFTQLYNSMVYAYVPKLNMRHQPGHLGSFKISRNWRHALQRRSVCKICCWKLPTNCQCNQYDLPIRIRLHGNPWKAEGQDLIRLHMLFKIINDIVKISPIHLYIKNGTQSALLSL